MPITPAQLPRTAEDVVNSAHFFNRVLPLYEKGVGDIELEADLDTARAVIPAASGGVRDFSFIAPEIPEFIPENCVGCMDCVTECPDTAILAKVLSKSEYEKKMAAMSPEARAEVEHDWAKTRKYYEANEKQKKEPGLFGIFIDPAKCKGCAECVQVCDDQALKMIKKTDQNMPQFQRKWKHYNSMGPTPKQFINDKVLADMMLADRTLQYVGGAGSCAGCGEATALRMFIAATCYVHGPENLGLIAATGCNTVY